MKKIVILFWVFIMSTCFALVSYANVKNLDEFQKDGSMFGNYIEAINLKESAHANILGEKTSTVTYTFINKEGKDITQEIKALILNAEAEAAYDLYIDNVAYAVKRSENVERAGDLTKTVVEEIERLCNLQSADIDIDLIPESHRNGRVLYRLQGAITYDPNTYKITSAAPVIRTYTNWMGWDTSVRPKITHEVSGTPVIASNKYSAIFDHTMHIWAEYGSDYTLATFDYGVFDYEFEIEVE